MLVHRLLTASVVAGSLAACSLVTSLDGLSNGTAADAGAGALASSSSGGAGVTTSSSSGGTELGGGSSSGGPGAGGDAGDSALDAEVAADGDGGSPHPVDTNDAGDATTTPDAGQSKDAGVADTGTTVKDSGPPPGYCASLGSAPLFCDDFDEGTALATPWDQLSTTGGAESVSNASFVSSPDSMLVTVNANASVSAIDLAGYKSFTGKQGVAGTATLTFEIKIESGDTSSASDAILGAIQLWNGSAYFDVELEAFYVASSNDFKVSMSEYGSTSSYVQHFASTHIALNAWTKVAIGITLASGSNSAAPATLALNGTNVVSTNVDVTTSDPIPEILVGTTYATPTAGGWAMAYDNVTFEEP